MKALFVLALAGVAAATPSLFLTQYVSVINGTYCAPSTGYTFAIFPDTGTIPSPTANPAGTVPFAVGVAPTTTTVPITQCEVTVADDFLVYCATGYSPTGINSNQFGVVGLGQTAATWATTGATATLPTDANQYYNFATNTSFKCVANSVYVPVCNYTCTGNCLTNSTSGTLLTNASVQNVCQAGYVGVANITTCPTTGLNTTTTIVCTIDPTLVPFSLWYLLADQYAHSIPLYCSCSSNVTCPSSIVCSPCYITCTARANTAATSVFCPTQTTISTMRACFQAGACAGAITAGDTCVYGPTGAGTDACPLCPHKSKKGLLGLLGLLGLIPLLLCLSLCCLLLLCIRRKKMAGGVHFATFDAGAPPLAAPHVHAVPTLHQTTFVGAPHIDHHAHLAY